MGEFLTAMNAQANAKGKDYLTAWQVRAAACTLVLLLHVHS
jgi:hypothetical protein